MTHHRSLNFAITITFHVDLDKFFKPLVIKKRKESSVYH